MYLYDKMNLEGEVMEQLELEVKVLDIDEKEFIKKLKKLGAKKIEETNQYLYTYDLATIYGRFIDILTQLNHPVSNIKYETALSKLRLFFFDVDNLLKKEEKKQLEKIVGEKELYNLLENENLLDILNQKEVEKFFKKYHNNDSKWIRVRETNGKTTSAVKHILAPNKTNLQQMKETEIQVSSIEEANRLLEALGFSYKSYQEKKRITYHLEDYEIDIDTWPGIPTYFEVEGKSLEDLQYILEKLGYSMSDTVSCTADQVYRMYGKSQFEKREMKFE